MPVKGRPLTKAHREAISEACKASERFQQVHRQPMTLEERARMSASSRVDRKQFPELWEKLRAAAIERLAIEDAEAALLSQRN